MDPLTGQFPRQQQIQEYIFCLHVAYESFINMQQAHIRNLEEQLQKDQIDTISNLIDKILDRIEETINN